MWEKKLQGLGFTRLQEKEDFIYYMKETEDVPICVMFDRNKRKWLAMDSWSASGEEMVEQKANKYWLEQIKRAISS